MTTQTAAKLLKSAEILKGHLAGIARQVESGSPKAMALRLVWARATAESIAATLSAVEVA